jgi:hypothetical protein
MASTNRLTIWTRDQRFQVRLTMLPQVLLDVTDPVGGPKCLYRLSEKLKLAELQNSNRHRHHLNNVLW